MLVAVKVRIILLSVVLVCFKFAIVEFASFKLASAFVSALSESD